MSRIVLLCLMGACMPAKSSMATLGPMSGADPTVGLIVADLQKRLPSSLAGDTIDRSRLAITKDTSEVMRAVVYSWGVYTPPRTADVLMVSVVVSVGQHHELVRSVADWARVAALNSWVPTAESDAITGCEELIRTTSPFRTPRWPARAYRDSASTPWRSISRPEKVLSLVQRPRVMNEANAWTVELWIIEFARVGLHRCRFEPSGITHTVLQAERNIGFPGT